jgi:hypothetical protein
LTIFSHLFKDWCKNVAVCDNIFTCACKKSLALYTFSQLATISCGEVGVEWGEGMEVGVRFGVLGVPGGFGILGVLGLLGVFRVLGLLEIDRKTAVLEIFAVLGILGVVGGFENT